MRARPGVSHTSTSSSPVASTATVGRRPTRDAALAHRGQHADRGRVDRRRPRSSTVSPDRTSQPCRATCAPGSAVASELHPTAAVQRARLLDRTARRRLPGARERPSSPARPGPAASGCDRDDWPARTWPDHVEHDGRRGRVGRPHRVPVHRRRGRREAGRGRRRRPRPARAPARRRADVLGGSVGVCASTISRAWEAVTTTRPSYGNDATETQRTQTESDATAPEHARSRVGGAGVGSPRMPPVPLPTCSDSRC